MVTSSGMSVEEETVLEEEAGALLDWALLWALLCALLLAEALLLEAAEEEPPPPPPQDVSKVRDDNAKKRVCFLMESPFF